MRSIRTFALTAAVAALGAGVITAPVVAQDVAQQVEATPPLEVGAVAPDFALPGGTRYGLLQEQVRLSDYAGQTVVLAFFFRARSRG